MRLLFVHDHPFYRENNLVFSGGGLPKSTWGNYLSFFDQITVFARLSKEEKDRKILSTSENVAFQLTTSYSSLFGILLNYPKLKREIYFGIANVDIVLVRLPSVLGFLAAFIAFSLKKKIIVEQVGNAKEALKTHGSIVGKIAAPIFGKINRHVVQRANYISYVTISKLQIDYPNQKLTTSLSDVLIDRIIRHDEIDYARFRSSKIKMGLIGGFDARYKGQDVLLEAISLLDRSVQDNIELFFVGKGNYEWLLQVADKLGVEKSIKFFGPKKPGSEIFDFLSSLSLYIQPSFTEGMPRALLEAMSVGCPVLGSTVGGIPDVIEANHLHTPGDYKTLSNQILAFYNDRRLLEQEALRSLAVIEPFQKENLDRKRKCFYTKILADLNNDQS